MLVLICGVCIWGLEHFMPLYIYLYIVCSFITPVSPVCLHADNSHFFLVTLVYIWIVLLMFWYLDQTNSWQKKIQFSIKVVFHGIHVLCSSLLCLYSNTGYSQNSTEQKDLALKRSAVIWHSVSTMALSLIDNLGLAPIDKNGVLVHADVTG